MIIQCPTCRSKYQYDEERFERKPSKKIKCAKCQTIFDIHNPAFAQRESKPVVGDETYARREETVSRFTRAEPLPDLESEAPPKVNPALRLPPGRRLSIAILDGEEAGKVFRIEKPRVTIGRAGADLVINDSEASRQHAAVEIRDTNYTVLDLGSTNGTLVGGSKISEPVELSDKGEFQIGTTTLMFIVTEEM